MVTLAAALQDHIATKDSVYDAPGELDIGNAPVTNAKKRAYGKITLEQAMWYSSNTVFGQVGVQLGSDLLVQMACNFGFNEEIPFDLPLATSLMPDPEEMTTWETAWAACGEPVGEHESPAGPQATVMEMALVGCAIANEGALMQPYLVCLLYTSAPDRIYWCPRLRRCAGTRGLGQASHGRHDRLLSAVRDSCGQSHVLDGHQGAGIPEYAVEQPHHR